MNKNAIQKFAVWARVQLIGAVKQRAFAYEITGNGGKPELDTAGGRLLTNAEKSQRRELIGEIRRIRSWKRRRIHGSTALSRCASWK